MQLPWNDGLIPSLIGYSPFENVRDNETGPILSIDFDYVILCI